MIDQTLIFIRDQINNYLMEIIHSKKAALGHLVNQSGQANINEIGITLINIEEDTSLKNNNPFQRIDDQNIAKIHPPVYLNLYTLISAYFGDTEEDYKEALKNLSRVIRFFQDKPVFNHQNSPGLDPGLERIFVKMVSLSFEQQNYLWSSLGGKYLPSVTYKIRPIEMARETLVASGPQIEEVIVNTGKME